MAPVAFPNHKVVVFLGAGGVGKTTLSAAFAVHQARLGKRVGLLSIDPAKRLKTALGVENLPDEGLSIPLDSLPGAKGSLIASSLDVNAALRLWVQEVGMPKESQDVLFASSLFKALSERLATATDTFAAARLAQWLEQSPAFDLLVVDTAPGLHALDFLIKPEKLAAFVDSKLTDWLKWFAAGGTDPKLGWIQKMVRGSAKMVLEGLAQIGGRGFIISFGQFLILLDQVFARMLQRLEKAVEWLRGPQCAMVVVCAPREDSVRVAKSLVSRLSELRMKPVKVILNRCYSQRLKEVIPKYQDPKGPTEQVTSQAAFVRLLGSELDREKRIRGQLLALPFELLCVESSLPTSPGVPLNLKDLDHLGSQLN